ncbi:4004_t:CDS:2 [Paraglomus occultum]|uniref:4004_t:CDS:1 n=1 Tax=Paraglomus occultum TaxID=144539 RepID=A0A9N9D2A9_9GLOM|nr:4004_t:CDS:2 [Paraglomus occultum]
MDTSKTELIDYPPKHTLTPAISASKKMKRAKTKTIPIKLIKLKKIVKKLITGEFRWNANTFQLDYITRQQLIEEREPEKKKKAKAQKDPHQDLSFDE